MKTLKVLTGIIAMLSVSILAMAASDKDAETEEVAPIEMKAQTACPVMGGAIDSTVYTDIQGQRVYHCCPMCSDKLVEDPDLYFKKAAKDGIVFENIQTTCPVSGEALGETAVQVDFEGRRIAFCCDKCVTKFNEDPQKILSTMDDSDRGEHADGDADHSGHEGHDH